VRARHIRKLYPAIPFDMAETELSQELEIYYQAIHSYPDHFARTRLSFQQHLLNIMDGARTQCDASGSERMKSAS
jgi:hypothetical protein